MNIESTVYAENVNKELPLSDYPRPMLKRDSCLILNGEWDFSYSKEEPDEYGEKILVPFPPESSLSGIGRAHSADEKLYYRRSFNLPDGFIKDRVILHFGAVDQICQVFINQTEIGSHEGGYIPFSFDVTELLKDGDNEIKLTVSDTLSHLYPYGKQKNKRGGMWYTPVSGIWQTVWLESIPLNHVESIKITQTLTAAKITVKTDAHHTKLTLLDSGEVFESNDGEFIISPKEPINWTPENPKLYYFSVETESDRVESYFALREIGVARSGNITRLTLNGKPYLFNGLLDQGYFSDGIFTPASYDAYADDIKLAKELGFNTLRKHIKIEPQIFYHLCDKLGMVVFQDMVNNSDYSFIRDTALPTVGFKRRSDKRLHKNQKSRTIFRETMADTLKLLYNHPSVLYYTIFNEGWGQFCADEAYNEAKRLDGTRIFDATSGWFWQKESDVESHHVYFKKLDIKVNPDLPVVISEFGGYSHRCEGHLFGEKNYGYRNFEKQKDFEDAVVSLYENEVLPLVKNGISALIYTQLSDVEDETNGFVTYDRRVVKVDTKRFSDIAKKLYDSLEEDK